MFGRSRKRNDRRPSESRGGFESSPQGVLFHSFIPFLEANIFSGNVANKMNTDVFSSELEKLRSLKKE